MPDTPALPQPTLRGSRAARCAVSQRRSFVKRQLTTVFRQFVADNKLPIALMIAIYLGTVAVGRLLGGRGYWQGFSNGFMLAGVIGSFLVLFLLHTGGLNQVAGAYGETRTQEELEKARKAGVVWGAVHNVELSDGDIDSVVLAPGGVLALETKWMMRELNRQWLARDIAQAQRGANKARLVLRSKNVDGGVHDVTPVLVIWGKAAVDVRDGGEEVDGVHVVDGNELKQWLARYSRGAMTQAVAASTLKSLEAFALTRAG